MLQQQPRFSSTREQRANAVMRASVYQAVAIGASSPDAIMLVLQSAWQDRKINLTPAAVRDALHHLRTAGFVVDSIQGINAIAGPRLVVDYDRGVALPEGSFRNEAPRHLPKEQS